MFGVFVRLCILLIHVWFLYACAFYIMVCLIFGLCINNGSLTIWI